MLLHADTYIANTVLGWTSLEAELTNRKEQKEFVWGVIQQLPVGKQEERKA